MLSKSTLAALWVLAFAPLARGAGQAQSFDYSSTKVQGVNLGSWFVLEPYMVPSLFTDNFSPDSIPVDEYNFTKQLGKDKAKQVLEQHWSTWITESDFAQIASWGFNTVRIPIGYWAFLARDEDPYVQGQVQYLDQAIEWARAHKLSVWIDLHGTPGSQNGYDNSGLRLDGDKTEWAGSESNRGQTLEVIAQISEKYGGSDYLDVVSGIQTVNEPNGILLNHDADGVYDYYKKAYPEVRNSSSNAVIIHDAFQGPGAWDQWFSENGYENAVIDHHHYQVFGGTELKYSVDEHIQKVCEFGDSIVAEEISNKVVGEWSAALDDCAKWLNGVGRGARYDGNYDGVSYIGSCDNNNDFSKYTEQQKEDKRRYIEAQLDAFERGSGWIFWSYKTESLLDWDVRSLIQNELFPQPLSDRKYPGQCGGSPGSNSTTTGNGNSNASSNNGTSTNTAGGSSSGSSSSGGEAPISEQSGTSSGETAVAMSNGASTFGLSAFALVVAGLSALNAM